MKSIKTYLDDLTGLFFPNLCTLCDNTLVSSEKHICSSCLAMLPQTNFQWKKENAIERKLRGRCPFDMAMAMYYFNTAGAVHDMLHQIKYRQHHHLAIYLGELMASKYEKQLENIDVLIPIPLHDKRFAERGYNQSEMIARGIASVLSIPIESKVALRIKNTETQTHKNRLERVENMKEAFIWQGVNMVRDKKMLLIDDVITTGATLESCIMAAPESIRTNISILSLAAAIDS